MFEFVFDLFFEFVSHFDLILLVFFFAGKQSCTVQLLETFSSGVNTGEGLAEAAARVEGEEPQHDTAIYWFSCTHKRQVRWGLGGWVGGSVFPFLFKA